VVAESGAEVQIDWHGHNDRGLALINSLTAVYAGANRVHGTALGIGERVGNTAIDQLLVNFQLLGWTESSLTELGDYCDYVGAVTGVPIPANYPVLGRDAFRTATGVHASAVIKALRSGNTWLANRVYSGVPAEFFGRKQSIEIGPMSGQSNVVYWLESRNVPVETELVDRIFGACKLKDSLMTEDEIQAIVDSWIPSEPATPGSYVKETCN
ncbi:MAG: 2-isopropylmalate synthase, partial [Chloroflexota bacterium]